jgi:hypothetical protein
LSVNTYDNSGLVEIGDKAFYGCSLGQFSVPRSVKVIGSRAFGNCHNLESIDICWDSSLREIGSGFIWGARVGSIRLGRGS